MFQSSTKGQLSIHLGNTGFPQSRQPSFVSIKTIVSLPRDISLLVSSSFSQFIYNKIDPYNLSSYLGKTTSSFLTKKAFKSGYEYDEIKLDDPDSSFVTYTYSPSFSYLNQQEGNTTFSLAANYNTKRINLVYYRFPLNSATAVNDIKSIMQTISARYGDPDVITATRFTADSYRRDLSASALYKQFEIKNPGIYYISWTAGAHQISLGITINAKGSFDGRVQIGQK